MMHLALRHLRYHWRLNAAMLLLLTLASTLLTGLASHGAAIAARELNQSLAQAHPAERNLLITGTPYTFSDELYEQLQDRLGKLLKERLVIRHTALPADARAASEEGDHKQDVALLDVFSFDELPDHVRAVEGKLPSQINIGEAIGQWPPPVEAVIGVRAAEQSGYGIGDRLSASGAYHRFEIVGIVDPLDASSDIWGGDLSAFAVLTGTVDTPALPLIIAASSMQSYLAAPVFPHDTSWRITLNHSLIRVDSAEALRADLINFQTQSATRQAETDTGLIQILAEALAQISRVRMPLLLLTLVTLILVVYVLTLNPSFIVDRSQTELAALSEQGASVRQITQPYALEALCLATPAFVLGPALAQCAIRLWAWTGGESVPLVVSRDTWLVSGIAVGLGWLVLVLPISWAARRIVRGEQIVPSRPQQQSVVHRRTLDLYLLIFGALLFWQLNRSGSIVMRRLGNTQLADPLLLIGPALLLIATGLVSLRLWPFLLRLIARLSQSLRGTVFPLALFRLARDPLQSSSLILLVSLTATVALFTLNFGDALADAQNAVMPYGASSTSLAEGLNSVYQLTTIMLVLFSGSAFFLVLFFSAQHRAREFGTLRAIGLSPGQGLALLIIEGVLVLCLGLLAGAVLGPVLSIIMIPYLLQASAGSLAAVTLERIQIDWPAVAWASIFLFLVYGLTLLLLLAVLTRTRVHWTSWKENE